MQTVEQELVERINGVQGQGFDYISEVYAIAKAAFEKIIEMDKAFGRVLQVIKVNYERYYDFILSDLPTIKRKPENCMMCEPKIPDFKELPKEPVEKLLVPPLKVSATQFVPEFQQEFMSNIDKFSTSWRKMILRHKTMS